MTLRALYNPISYNSTDGIAFEIYLTGCNREPKCKNCHNPELWSFDSGEEIIDYHALIDFIYDIRHRYDNIAVLGGEPLHQDSDELLRLLAMLSTLNKPIWLYTSYELEDVSDEVLEFVDYVKTGAYDEETKGEYVVNGVALASANQKIHAIIKGDY